MNEVTQLLDAASRGETQAAEQLLPLVYEELRRMAAQKLAHEKPGQTLQATALVHEAYLRLVGKEDEERWKSRGHFFGAAAEAMRRILVEHARRKKRRRHGGDYQRVPLDGLELALPESSQYDLAALDEALDRLNEFDSGAACVVKLRYFAGLTIEETAKVLDISVRSANRHFAFAKAWLFQQLRTAQSE